jgi:uncharacterized lipoprotein YmbA
MHRINNAIRGNLVAWLALFVALVLVVTGCGSSHQVTLGYFNMRTLAEAVAQENVSNGNAAVVSVEVV